MDSDLFITPTIYSTWEYKTSVLTLGVPKFPTLTSVTSAVCMPVHVNGVDIAWFRSWITWLGSQTSKPKWKLP